MLQGWYFLSYLLHKTAGGSSAPVGCLVLKVVFIPYQSNLNLKLTKSSAIAKCGSGSYGQGRREERQGPKCPWASWSTGPHNTECFKFRGPHKVNQQQFP